MKKLVVHYFADIMGDLESQCDILKKLLNGLNIPYEFMLIDFSEASQPHPFTPPLQYDILFFDWGGMSIGNSILENGVREILKLAVDYPNKFFVMDSSFTAAAMEDAQRELEDEEKNIPANIFLDTCKFIDFYKEVIK